MWSDWGFVPRDLGCRSPFSLFRLHLLIWGMRAAAPCSFPSVLWGLLELGDERGHPCILEDGTISGGNRPLSNVPQWTEHRGLVRGPLWFSLSQTRSPPSAPSDQPVSAPLGKATSLPSLYLLTSHSSSNQTISYQFYDDFEVHLTNLKCVISCLLWTPLTKRKLWQRVITAFTCMNLVWKLFVDTFWWEQESVASNLLRGRGQQPRIIS